MTNQGGVQPIAVDLLLLLSSLAVLVISANRAVSAITRFSKAVGISELSSGLVIVSVSTSLPETTVAIFSATSGNIGVTLGDVFGSNVTNIALIAAILLVISPLRSIEDKNTVLTLSWELIAASLIPLLLLVVRVGSRLVGLALLAVFVYFVLHTLRQDKHEKSGPFVGGSGSMQLAVFLAMILIVIVSARGVVESVSSIAALTGVRKSIIGASVVALGTSLPELTVDTIAAKKGHIGLAFGDIIGSCVTNITLVLGIGLSLSSVTTDFRILGELVSFAIAAPVALLLLIRRGRASRWHAIVLLVIYSMFLAVIFSTQYAIGT